MQHPVSPPSWGQHVLEATTGKKSGIMRILGQGGDVLAPHTAPARGTVPPKAAQRAGGDVCHPCATRVPRAMLGGTAEPE